MNFTTKLPIMTKEGNAKNNPINVDHVVMLDKIPIDTGLKGGDGETPLVKTGTGLFLSNGMVLPCPLPMEEVLNILNGLENDQETST